MDSYHNNDFDFNEPLKNQEPSQQNTIDYQSGSADRQEQRNSGKSVAAMVLGIVGLLFSAFFIVSLPCAIIAMIFGRSEDKERPNGMAKAGFIMGLIGIILTVLILILYIALFSLGMSLAYDYYDYDDYFGDYGDYYDDYYDYDFSGYLHSNGFGAAMCCCPGC